MLEWLLTIPNFGAEFDLSPSPYNRMTLGLSAKYNWNTYHRYAPSVVFNVFDVRPEFRYYYRTKKRPVYKYRTDRYLGTARADTTDWVKYNADRENWKFSDWFNENVWTVERKDPKPARAQYLGIYADYATFSFKFGRKGIQGQAIGLGASYGWGLPLYEYNRGAIDIEFGFSVGLQVAKYDTFTHNPDGNYYTKLAPESRNFHFTPFPVISELRVAFAWRHVSVKDRYTKEDPQKIRFGNSLKDLNAEFDDAKAKFDRGLDEKLRNAYAADDSLYRSAFVQSIEETLDRFKNNNVDSDPILNQDNKEKLKSLADSRSRKAIKEFDRAVRKEHAAENKKHDAAEDKEEVSGRKQKAESVSTENPQKEKKVRKERSEKDDEELKGNTAGKKGRKEKKQKADKEESDGQ